MPLLLLLISVRQLPFDAAAIAAKAAATTALATPNAENNAAAQTAFNTLNTLTDSSPVATSSVAAFVTAYSTFKKGLNTANTAVDTAMATAAPIIAAAQASLATENGLAFGKLTSVDSTGLITYLGKDGITTNYYNTSGAVGVAANAANAATVQRLAVVNVVNPGGLEKAGGTLFRPTTASGVTATSFSLADNSANGSSEKYFPTRLSRVTWIWRGSL